MIEIKHQMKNARGVVRGVAALVMILLGFFTISVKALLGSPEKASTYANVFGPDVAQADYGPNTPSTSCGNSCAWQGPIGGSAGCEYGCGSTGCGGNVSCGGTSANCNGGCGSGGGSCGGSGGGGGGQA